jgi:SAM-dependent methyltransferase
MLNSIDAIVCHNTLECVADPVRLINEAARILRPGGRSVWSHTDFDTIVINTNDVELSRRVLHAYADLTQPWMAHSDARMGRKLVGLVERSTLRLADLDAQVLVASERSPPVADRIDNITAALAVDPLLARDVLRWHQEVDDAIAAGEFLFGEMTFVVTAIAA